MSYVKNLSLININPDKISNLIKSNIANDYQKYGRQNISYLGFNLDEMILSCHFGNIPCNIAKDFAWHYSYDFVNCYTFNSGRDQNENSVPLKYIGEDEPNKSLQLEIFIGIDKIQSEFILNSGLNIVIHGHNLERVLPGKGKQIPSGYDISFGVSMLNRTRLDSPYNNCIKNVKSQSSFSSYFFKAIFNVLNMTIYSQNVCFEICLQDYIKNACGCLDGSLPNIYLDTNITICKTLNILDCVSSARVNYYNSALSSECFQCPSECDILDYNVVFTSESRFSSFYKEYIWNNLNLSKLFPSSSKTPDLSNSVVKLNIFYDDLKVTYLHQTPLLTTKDLVSKVGGIVGLFLGMTLMEIPKLIELFIDNLILLVEFNKPQKVNFI